jgi:hypothetical protein
MHVFDRHSREGDRGRDDDPLGGGVPAQRVRVVRAFATIFAGLAVVAGALMQGTASAAGERHWLAPVPFVGAGPLVGQPVLVATSGGDMVLAWARGGADPAVLASTRPADAPTWPAPERLSQPCAPPVTACLHFSLAAAANASGAVAVSWTLGGGFPVSRSTVTVATRAAGSTAWDGPVAVDAPSDAIVGSDVGVAGDGGVALIWGGGASEARSAFRPAGSGWEPAQAISGGLGSSSVRVSAGQNGDVLASWLDQPGCRPTVARRRHGGAWEAPVVLDANPILCLGVAIEPRVTPDGEALAVWDGRSGVDDVLFSASSGAHDVAWTPALPLGPSRGLSIQSRRLLAAPAGATSAVWGDELGRVLVSRRPAGGSWSAATEVPGLTGPLIDGPAAAQAGDGTLLVALGATGAQPTRAVVGDPQGGWGPVAPIGPASWIGESWPRLAATTAGDAVAAWRSGEGLVTVDYTSRPGPVFTVPSPILSGLKAPARIAAGAIAVLSFATTVPGTQPVVVERRLGGRWRLYARALAVAATPGSDTEIRVRTVRRTTLRLRVRGASGGPPSAAVTIRVTRPSRPRIAVGEDPTAITVGLGFVWVLGAEPGGATVRRLDPRTGRARGAVIHVGGTSTSIAAGAGALWVVRNGRELLRMDPRSGAIAATNRYCGGAQVVADATQVWVTDACVPGEPRVGLLRDTTVAYRVDPATAAPLGPAVRIPDASVQNAALIGGALWLWGETDASYDDTALMRVEARSGVDERARVFAGRFGVPLVPVSGREVWINNGSTITAALPRSNRVIVDASRPRPPARFVLASTGSRVWALESRGSLGSPVARRLISFDLTGARRRGPTKAVGVFPPGSPFSRKTPALALSDRAAWVLVLEEGAVIRVPIPR